MNDLISRQAAIDAVVAETIYTEEELKEYYEANSHRNEWVNGIYDAVEAIKQLPPIQPEITHEQAVDYLDSTGWLREHDRQMMLDGVHRLTAQPEIVRCKDCKHWIPYDWMFSEVWQSKNIADYPEDDIGCDCSEMAMKANDFCSRAERRTE